MLANNTALGRVGMPMTSVASLLFYVPKKPFGSMPSVLKHPAVCFCRGFDWGIDLAFNF